MSFPITLLYEAPGWAGVHPDPPYLSSRRFLALLFSAFLSNSVSGGDVCENQWAMLNMPEGSTQRGCLWVSGTLFNRMKPGTE